MAPAMATLRGITHHGFEATVPEHLEDLGVFLAILLERELTLLVTVATGLAISSTRGSVRMDGRAAVGGVAWGGRGISHSFSFFPLRLFLPPFPLFLGILTVGEGFAGVGWVGWLVFQGGRAGELEKSKVECTCGVWEKWSSRAANEGQRRCAYDCFVGFPFWPVPLSECTSVGPGGWLEPWLKASSGRQGSLQLTGACANVGPLDF